MAGMRQIQQRMRRGRMVAKRRRRALSIMVLTMMLLSVGAYLWFALMGDR